MATETQVFGRCSEINQLIDMLLDTSTSDTDDNISVVSIAGRRGVGKTTVAQSVYCNRKVEKHFDLKAWICFKSKPFQLRISMIDMTRSAPMEISDYDNDLLDLLDLDRIEEILCEVLKGNKYLIVLDSVWDERNWKEMRSYWLVLYAIFDQLGKEGSKILVTTCSHDVANYLNARGAIVLKCLKDQVFWKLFRSCAFGDDANLSENLECIGQEISNKLVGLPLAAKVVGGLLHSRMEEHYWRDVLDNMSWQQDQETDGILTSLRLSYEFLPQHLKPCFLYCSLFPEEHRFEKDALVHYWMALDYIGSCAEGGEGEKRTPEDVGRDYFTELQHRSFFQKRKMLETSKTEFYVTHSLLHDVAKFVAGDVIYRYEYGNFIRPRIPNEVCHLYLGSTDWVNVLRRQISEVKKLQSLVVHPPPYTDSTVVDLKAIFTALSNVRILIFLDQDVATHVLTECVDSMLQLRYLEVAGGAECYKPWGGNHLCHLQVLKVTKIKYRLDDISFGSCLTQVFAKLNNLRHLYMDFYSAVSGIGLLTSLQELSRVFKVGEHEGKISQLKHLNQLRGSLLIKGLENVRDEREAKEAMLENKEYLEKLDLCWSPADKVNAASIERNENVLRGLQPHSNLKELKIISYWGPMAPSWISETKLSNIERIELFGCRIMQVFPPLGELPLLRVLRLVNLDFLEYIGNEVYGKADDQAFPMLEELVLLRLLQLKEWSEPKGGGKITMMPRLRILEIQQCRELKLPIPFALDSPLGEFKVGLYSPKLKGISLLTTYIPVNCKLSGLKILSIGPTSKVERFSGDENEWFERLTSLEELRFTDCEDLKSLPATLRSLPSLKRLHIDKCRQIHFLLEELPAALEELNMIDNCLQQATSAGAKPAE
ncbi:putative disease resistance protein RGA3 [Zingiber officinale]|nr:putative disease resistance protein RGA3 [Zingiber officinale]